MRRTCRPNQGWVYREVMSEENTEQAPQEPDDGKAMGAVRRSDRPDPITGKPLYDPEESEEKAPSSSVAGDTYVSDKGIDQASTEVPPGQPSSTPRREPGLRDL